MAKTQKVVSVNGNTAAPGKATPEEYLKRGLKEVPGESILAGGVPAAVGALLTALSRFGRLSFSEVIEPALDYAKNGFPVHTGLYGQERYGIRDLEEKFLKQWPGSANVYLQGGKAAKVGQVITNSALAGMLDYLKSKEKSNSGEREKGLKAVMDEFYKGDPATEIEIFSNRNNGFLTREDLEKFETHFEEPVSIEFENTRVYKCGPWNQGPVMLQALSIMENYNLRGMGHNSEEYLHCTIEAFKLAFADREQYYGDPSHVHVPIRELLSKEYSRMRAELIDKKLANSELRPGNPMEQEPLLPFEKRLGGESWGHGTVHVDVIDREGNMVAFTPSGAWIKSAEVIPSLGFPLGNRLMTFYLEPKNHPNLIAPYKRPRTTISPSLAFQNNRPWMVFGSMGGDQQDQWQCQFFLNRVLFDMSLQEAIEAPKFSSEHFPGFFSPHDRSPNLVRIEPRVRKDILDGLKKRGHKIAVGADWSEGYLLAAAKDPQSGVLEAGCDPRGTKGEIFAASVLCW